MQGLKLTPSSFFYKLQKEASSTTVPVICLAPHTHIEVVLNKLRSQQGAAVIVGLWKLLVGVLTVHYHFCISQ